MALALTNLGVSANPDIADTTNVLACSNASWTPPYVINVPTIAPTFLISRAALEPPQPIYVARAG
jgi:hypothetical protein